jgi:hypothetical protein
LGIIKTGQPLKKILNGADKNHRGFASKNVFLVFIKLIDHDKVAKRAVGN